MVSLPRSPAQLLRDDAPLPWDHEDPFQHSAQLRSTERSRHAPPVSSSIGAGACQAPRHTPGHAVHLTENHRLKFFAFLSKEELTASSPGLWGETVELQTSWCSFQQNPGGRKVKADLFSPVKDCQGVTSPWGTTKKSPSVPPAVCVAFWMLIPLLVLVALVQCCVYLLPHGPALQAAGAR